MVAARSSCSAPRARSSSGGATSSRSSAAGRRDFTCEDIELTFRVHRTLRERGRDYRIACLPDCIGVTEGPDSVRKLVVAAGALAAGHPRDVLGEPAHVVQHAVRAVGLLGVPFYLVSEILAPVFEIVAIGTSRPRRGLRASSNGGSSPSRPCDHRLRQQRASRPARSSCSISRRASYTGLGIARLFVLMPLEMVVYRPIMAWARLKGTWRFLRGDRAWHKFERNVACRGDLMSEAVVLSRVEGGAAAPRHRRGRGDARSACPSDARAPRMSVYVARGRGCARGGRASAFAYGLWVDVDAPRRDIERAPEHDLAAARELLVRDPRRDLVVRTVVRRR